MEAKEILKEKKSSTAQSEFEGNILLTELLFKNQTALRNKGYWFPRNEKDHHFFRMDLSGTDMYPVFIKLR